MHVGLNLIFLVPREIGGMEVYARGLAPALAAAAPGLRLTAFVNLEAADAGIDLGAGIRTVTVPVRARSRVEWVRGEQQLLPPLARRERVDLVHSLASTAPVWGRFRRVTTIHDLIYRRYPEAHFGLRTLGMRVLVPLAARRSHRVIAISRSTAEDLHRFLRLDPAKVDVVPQGHGDPPALDGVPEPVLRERLALGERPVLLTLSAKRPVKNLPRLLEALARIPREERPILVMPGYPTPYEQLLRERIAALDLDGDVRMPGWLDDEEVEGLWRIARGFAYPSLYEGFGAPVVEAMARGVPVACSDRSSLPEVVGDAAVLFDPEDVDAMAAALRRLLADDGLAQRLVAAGRERAARFTWEATARGTLAVYERALGSASAAAA